MGLVAFARTADAKKRIVVLDFSGPKAEGYQTQVEGVIKKVGTMVSAQKWLDAADELGASKMSSKNITKIAGKLKVDGVVMGSVDRRGSRYFVHVKLRAGATGEQVAEVQLVVRGGKLSSSDLGEVKDQIGGAIASLEAPGAADEDEDVADEPKHKDKHKGKGKHKITDDDESSGDDEATASDDEDAKPKGKDKHKGFRGHDRTDDDVAEASDDEDADADAKPKGKAKGKHKGKAIDEDADVADDEDAKPKGKAKGKSKDRDEDASDEASSDDSDGDRDRVASRDDEASSDDDEAIGAEGELARDPHHRPFDALAGLSFTSRNLSFTTSPGLTNKPQGYKSGVPVTGVFVDADLYPLAFNGKNKSITRDLGLTVMFDRVLSINSQLQYTDMTGAKQTATLGTTEQHYAAGVIFRYALGKTPSDATIYASVRYNRSKFVIAKEQAPMGVTVDIPNTDYTYVDPGVAIRYPVNPKIAIVGGVRALIITNTGEMQQPDQYGAATVLGFDVDAGGDYMLDKAWFIHAGLKLSTIGFSFKGTGTLSNNRDGDATTTDVSAARDTYYGAVVTAGYLY
ncbi:MAG TPA: hypothetical protein VL463_31175 [Kofleriaceae bacterium]|nr:hypothetical protein [Kofleriaceae bacterium]